MLLYKSDQHAQDFHSGVGCSYFIKLQPSVNSKVQFVRKWIFSFPTLQILMLWDNSSRCLQSQSISRDNLRIRLKNKFFNKLDH